MPISNRRTVKTVPMVLYLSFVLIKIPHYNWNKINYFKIKIYKENRRFFGWFFHYFNYTLPLNIIYNEIEKDKHD